MDVDVYAKGNVKWLTIWRERQQGATRRNKPTYSMWMKPKEAHTHAHTHACTHTHTRTHIHTRTHTVSPSQDDLVKYIDDRPSINSKCISVVEDTHRACFALDKHTSRMDNISMLKLHNTDAICVHHWYDPIKNYCTYFGMAWTGVRRMKGENKSPGL